MTKKPTKDLLSESSSDDKDLEISDDYELGKPIFSSELDSEEDKPIGAEIPVSDPVVKSEKKRRRSEETSKEASSKLAKNAIPAEDEEKIGKDTKGTCFQRLWNENDEVAMLQGIIDFKADTGKNMCEDCHGFYKFIKKLISFEASFRQCMDKIRHLERKYMKNTKKGVEPKSFLNAYDEKCYKLSNFIWGDEGIDSMKSDDINSNKKKSAKIKCKKKKKLDSLKQDLFSSPNDQKVEIEEETIGVSEYDWFENWFLGLKTVYHGVDDSYVKARWSNVPMDAKKKLDEKWELLNAKMFKCAMQKANFIYEVTSLLAKPN